MGTNPPYRSNIADVTGIEASIARILQTMDFWSDIVPTVTVNATAADISLPDIVVAEIPSGATVVRAILMFTYVKRIDSSASSNASVAAQVISIDAASARDSVVTGINIPDNSFATKASTEEGGMAIVGDNDVAAEVAANATYYVTWELADVDGASLVFTDVQVGLRVWYSI